MNHLKTITLRRLFLVLAFCSQYLLADEYFDPQAFIDTVSIKIISEIETAKIALQKSTSTDVKTCAQFMIDENTVVLENLRLLATNSHLQMLGDEELRSKAHKYIFKRTGQTFDAAYVETRIAARRKTINIFREAIEFGDPATKSYAVNVLPTLMRQLYAVQQLHEDIKFFAEQRKEVKEINVGKLL